MTASSNSVRLIVNTGTLARYRRVKRKPINSCATTSSSAYTGKYTAASFRMARAINWMISRVSSCCCKALTRGITHGIGGLLQHGHQGQLHGSHSVDGVSHRAQPVGNEITVQIGLHRIQYARQSQRHGVGQLAAHKAPSRNAARSRRNGTANTTTELPFAGIPCTTAAQISACTDPNASTARHIDRRARELHAHNQAAGQFHFPVGDGDDLERLRDDPEQDHDADQAARNRSARVDGR